MLGHQKGFTLIELVITIVIVAILTIVAVSSYNRLVLKSMISEGKTIAGSIARIEKVHYAQKGQFFPIEYTDFLEKLDFDTRSSKYFNIFGVSVPGTEQNADFTVCVKSTIDPRLENVYIILHGFLRRDNIIVIQEEDVNINSQNNPNTEPNTPTTPNEPEITPDQPTTNEPEITPDQPTTNEPEVSGNYGEEGFTIGNERWNGKGDFLSWLIWALAQIGKTLIEFLLG